MRIVLNGVERVITPGASVADAAALVGVADDERGVAAAVGGEVIPRGHWERAMIREWDRIEIVRAAAGG